MEEEEMKLTNEQISFLNGLIAGANALDGGHRFAWDVRNGQVLIIGYVRCHSIEDTSGYVWDLSAIAETELNKFGHWYERHEQEWFGSKGLVEDVNDDAVEMCQAVLVWHE